MFISSRYHPQIDETAILRGGGHVIFGGDDIRIDAFALFVVAEDWSVKLENHVHIGPHCQINATGGNVIFKEGSCLDGGSRVFTKSDEFRRMGKMGPTWDDKEHTIWGSVTIGAHSAIGPNSVVLPRVQIADYVAVGALSLVSRSIDQPGWLWAGIPAKPLMKRET